MYSVTFEPLDALRERAVSVAESCDAGDDFSVSSLSNAGRRAPHAGGSSTAASAEAAAAAVADIAAAAWPGRLPWRAAGRRAPGPLNFSGSREANSHHHVQRLSVGADAVT